MSNLSLWQIEDSIIGLQEIIEAPESTEEEKAAARGELDRWVQEEVGKVDRVRAFLRHCAVMSDAAKFEADAMKRRGDQWAERGRRLKEICISAMQARGVKRLEGQSGVLRVQKAGGLQALNITNEALIPEAFRIHTIVLKSFEWLALCRVLRSSQEPAIAGLIECAQAAKVSNDTEAIRKAMETPCCMCEGTGHFLQADGPDLECQECRGTGRQLVPGAELAERKSTLRVE